MPKFIDLTGRRFGKLVVVEYLGRSTWMCLCTCGSQTRVNGQALRGGRTVTCGCGLVERNKARAKHGMYRTRVYRQWHQMIQRCYNPNNSRYQRYGGRGITVCDRWRLSFDAFYADMGDPPEGTSIDRIDNARGYEPGNCRWATPQEQANNRYTNVLIEHDGVSRTIAEWARHLGLPYHRLVHRHRIGWVPPQLFSRDNHKGKTTVYTVQYQGREVTMKELSVLTGTKLQTLYARLYAGKPLF